MLNTLISLSIQLLLYIVYNIIVTIKLITLFYILNKLSQINYQQLIILSTIQILLVLAVKSEALMSKALAEVYIARGLVRSSYTLQQTPLRIRFPPVSNLLNTTRSLSIYVAFPITLALGVSVQIAKIIQYIIYSLLVYYLFVSIYLYVLLEYLSIYSIYIRLQIAIFYLQLQYTKVYYIAESRKLLL